MNDDDRSWTYIGFRFGLGFWAAGAVFSLVGALLTWVALTHQFSTAASRAKARAADQHERAPRNDPAPEAFGAAEDLPLIVVPPRSVEACKALTGGQINEDFARCRRGYTEQR